MSGSRFAAFAILASSIASTSCSDASGPSGLGFSLRVTSPVGATLGTTQTIDVEVESTSYAGVVALAVNGAPADWVVAIVPSATVTVGAGAQADVTVQVTIPSNGTPAPSGRQLTVGATSTTGVDMENVSLAVANEFVLPIVGGMGAHWGARAGTTVTLKAGTLLRILNDHTDSHTVHATDEFGMSHQPDPGMTSGQSYTATVTAGSEPVYCHAHGPVDDAVNFVVVP